MTDGKGREGPNSHRPAKSVQGICGRSAGAKGRPGPRNCASDKARIPGNTAFTGARGYARAARVSVEPHVSLLIEASSPTFALSFREMKGPPWQSQRLSFRRTKCSAWQR